MAGILFKLEGVFDWHESETGLRMRIGQPMVTNRTSQTVFGFVVLPYILSGLSSFYDTNALQFTVLWSTSHRSVVFIKTIRVQKCGFVSCKHKLKI